MTQSIVRHQTKNTYNSEFHSHICENGERMESHFHKNFEIIVCLKNSCQLTVAENKYVLREGQAAFIMPFQIHSFSTENGAAVRCTTLRKALILTLAEVLDGSIPNTPVFNPSKETFDYFSNQSPLLFGKNSGMLERISPPFKRLKTKGIL